MIGSITIRCLLLIIVLVGVSQVSRNYNILFCEGSDSLITLSTWEKIDIYIDSCVRSAPDTVFMGSTNSYQYQNHYDPERIWADFRVIRQTVFRKHEIFIVNQLPIEVLGTGDGEFSQVIMIGDDSSITFFDETNHTNNFNIIMHKESLFVQSPQQAEEIAKLFLRMLFPYIHGSFFIYELRYEPEVYFKKHVRSELVDPGMLFFEYMGFCRLQKEVKKALNKLTYDIKTSKTNEYYEVDVGFINGMRYGFEPVKIKYIKIKVFFNGTIDYKLPKGITWVKFFDVIY